MTTLKRRLIPLVRYLTNDIGVILGEKCVCGQEKVLKVIGREQDMLISASVHFTVNSFAGVLAQFPQCSSVFQIKARKQKKVDDIEVVVETKDKIKNNSMTETEKAILEKWSEEIPDIPEAVCSGKIGSVEVRLVDPGGLPRSDLSGKVKRIVDLRQ